MADISKIKLGNTSYNMKDASAPLRQLINYSKSGSLPISSDDTIQGAIGKLENNMVPNSSLVGTEGMIAEPFDSTTAYSVGDIVTYEHGLYEFTSAHSAGAWDSAEVTEVNVVDIIGNIDSVLEAVL